MARPSTQRIVFVTGKGGVGKSLVAAATAVLHARQGRRVLLVELGQRSVYHTLFGLQGRPAADDADGGLPWREGIAIARWDAESALREYIAHYLPFKLADKLLGNAAMKALVAVAPGLSDLALLGKLTAPLRHDWYDRAADVVVVDGYSTGQFLAFLRAPKGLAATVGSGPIHTQTEAINRLLRDRTVCDYQIVTLPEALPAAETIELAETLRAEIGLAPRVLCNRVMEWPARQPPLASVGPAARAFLHPVSDAQRRQKRALTQLDALRGGVARSVQRLPWVASLDAEAVVDALADALAAATASSAGTAR